MQFLKTALLVASLLSGAEAALRVFNFTLLDEFAAPDGYIRKYTLINDTSSPLPPTSPGHPTSPGPRIDVDQGDEVHVIVTNNGAENATVHFHGIEMIGTPWNDGVPGVSQRPIKPGETYNYRWFATQYGAYWYHSHYRGQIEDGLYGSIAIRPNSSIPKPFSVISPSEVPALIAAEADRKPLIISDVTHLDSHQKQNATATAQTEISCYDSIVFNGKGNVNCLSLAEVNGALTDVQKGYLSFVPGAEMTNKACIPPEVIDAAFGGTGHPELMPREIFNGCQATFGSREIIDVQSDKWVAIDVIGANNFILASFSIDEHDMWVYAVDGEYINPQKVQAFELFNGDRVSILVKPKGNKAVKIRVHAATPPQMLIGHAVLALNGDRNPNPASQPWINLTGHGVNSTVTFLDHFNATQFNHGELPRKADAFFKLEMKADASWLWALAHDRLDPATIDTANRPILFQPNFTDTRPFIITTKMNTWVDLLFWSNGQGPMPPHPVHKHGVKMYHIGSGTGNFTWNSVNEAIDARPDLFNLFNPPKVDAVMTPEGIQTPVWSAVRYHVTNPGAWAVHCHIHNHVEGGMLAVIQDGSDAWPQIPQEYWDILDS